MMHAWMVTVFGAGLTVAGLALLASASRLRAESHRAQFWPATQGRVTRSEIGMNLASRRTTFFPCVQH